MRIYHPSLLPRLCRPHILAAWREGLGAYSIITNGKKGYSHHPAVLEFKNSPSSLFARLKLIRKEMLARGYNPKELPPEKKKRGKVNEWQTLSEQIQVLRNKGCMCVINR